MKLFTKNIKLILLVSLIVISIVVSQVSEKKKTKSPSSKPEHPPNPSDAVWARIESNIMAIAEEKMKSSDLMRKKKLAGVLPEGYPEETVKAALATRNNKKVWNPILRSPTELYRMCLYPYAKVNYVKWCNNNFFGAKNKGDTCRYSFCEVCCDHLAFVYQNAAEKNLIGELLQLNQEQGIKSIKDVVNRSVIHSCKIECKVRYPVDMPTPLPLPPRDPSLGQEKNPGLSCADIKKWGAASNASDIYWIEVGTKGPQQVFCDMETDKGGWTLFFNYIHQPGQELSLNENKLPSDLKSSSHMYLINAGYDLKRDVKVIRFMCTESFKGVFKFWHFKTENRDIIEVARTGDQTSLKPNSLESGYAELKLPGSISPKYRNAVDRKETEKFKFVAKSTRGGFSSTVFGSSSYSKYWTVKGDNPTQDIFECGTMHRSPGFTSPDNNPAMVKTHHSIWFRGDAPSIDDARDRYTNKVAK